MPVADDGLFYPAEHLILKQPRRHFRTSISPIHWQLRSLIGAGANGAVYYPTGCANLRLRRLDTNTLKAETVKLLSFSPRCLVVKDGWICCGGETGEFTALRLEDLSGSERQGATAGDRTGSRLDDPMNLDLDVDTRLPLDASRRNDPVLSLLLRSRHKPTKKKFGNDRVNCITLWLQSSYVEPFHTAYRSPVAVLANNDKHVTLVNLETMVALDVIPYPDCVNRAVLSPDGRLLAAVGDDPYLYVHERVERRSAPGQYDWRRCSKIHLKSQRKDDTTDHRGSFAACFSNTGTYLAVGTQYGVISIFRTSAFLEPGQDPLMTYFTSSRPNMEWGAVREMAFSPGPVDLLAWSEDHGRVGVADVRTRFISRQILHLDAATTYEHLDLVEKPNTTIDSRLFESRSNRGADTLEASVASSQDLSTTDAGHRASRRLEAPDRYHYPLTREETQVLEALQEHRRRREQRVADQRAVAATQDILLAARSPWIPLRLDERGTTAVTYNNDGSTTTITGTLPAPAALDTPAWRGDETRMRERMSGLANDLYSTYQSQRDRIREIYREVHRETQRDLILREAAGSSARREERGEAINTAEQESSSAAFSRPSRLLLFASRAAAAAESGASEVSGSNNDSSGNNATRPPGPRAAIRSNRTGSGARLGPPTVPGTASVNRERLLSRILANSSQGGAGGSNNASHNVWSEIEALYNMSSPAADNNNTANNNNTSNATTTSNNSSTGNSNRNNSELPVPDDDATRRERAAFWISLMGQMPIWDPEREVIRRTSGASYIPTEMPAPDETAGLAWSEDGSTLYVGAEDGIYEFKVNVTSRKMLPSITLR